MKIRNALGGLLPGFRTGGTLRSVFTWLEFRRSMACLAVLAIWLAEGRITLAQPPQPSANEIHDLNDSSSSYEATAGVRDIFIWDMRIGATNGQQDIIPINGFDRSEDVLVFKAPATLDYANPNAPYIQSGVWANNVDSLVDTYYGEETYYREIWFEGEPWEWVYEYYTYSEGSYRLLENSLQRHDNAYGPTVFGEFEVEYSDVPGAEAPRDIFQINELEYVGVTGVQELLVMGDGGILPLAVDVASLTSPFLFYNGVEVILPTSNNPPTSNAGPDQSIRVGDVVILDGNDSFDDNTAQASLTYAWSFYSKPAASNAVLVDSTSVSPSFVADVAGTYTLALLVTDEDGLESEPAFVSISSNNLAPTAIATASATLAVVGGVVVFDGANSSDPDFDEITYAWEITSAPQGSAAELVGGETASPSMIPDIPGVYEVSLVVSDFLGPGLPTAVELTATTAEGFAEFLILEVSAQVAALSADQVTTKGNQTAFGQHLANAIRDLQEGKTAEAIDKLNKAIERTDGCPLRGAPDGNGKGRDWIIDCDAQYDIYDALKLAVETLEPAA
jgi:hypothetical protein